MVTDLRWSKSRVNRIMNIVQTFREEADRKRWQRIRALEKVAEVSSILAEFLHGVDLGAGSSKLLSRLDDALEELYECEK